MSRPWNKEFQETLESISDQTVLDEEERFARLASLADDFLAVATECGRTIIREKDLPHDAKTIKPLKLGIAGGQKYCTKGIFFKFAIDDKGLFGSDEFAAKTAGQELLALSKLLQCEVKQLHFPLMTLIDFRGFRLSAVSVLPINARSLVYGSNDGGRTIYNESDEYEANLKRVCRILNLDSHKIVDSQKKEHKLYGPFDMEGHTGLDGRLYCLDFARLFPCEPPQPLPHLTNPSLHRMLRPELVRKSMLPVASDAFLAIPHLDKSAVKTVNKLYQLLKTKCIPNLAAFLSTQPTVCDARSNLSSYVHHYGVNMRYLGLVRQRTKNSDWRSILLVDIVSRTLKNMQNQRFRALRTQLQGVSVVDADTKFTADAVAFLNTVFGEKDGASDGIWSLIKEDVQERRFVGALSSAEEKQDLRTLLLHKSLVPSNDDRAPAIPLLHHVLRAFTSVMHYSFNHDLYSVNFNVAEPFSAVATDARSSITLTSIDLRAKHMPFVSYCKGTVGLIQCIRLAHGQPGRVSKEQKAGIKKMAKIAQDHFDDSLRYSLDDSPTLANYSFLVQHAYFDNDYAMDLLKRSIEANPYHTRSLYYLAQLYDRHKNHNFDKAEEYYLKAIEVSEKKHINALKDYGNFLRFKRKRVADAERYYRIALKNEPQHSKVCYNLSTLLFRDKNDIESFDEAFHLMQTACLAPSRNFAKIDKRSRYQYFQVFSRVLRLRAEITLVEFVNGVKKTNKPVKKSQLRASRQPLPILSTPDKFVPVPGIDVIHTDATQHNHDEFIASLSPALQECDKAYRQAVEILPRESGFVCANTVAYADYLCHYLRDLCCAEQQYRKAFDELDPTAQKELVLAIYAMSYITFLWKAKQNVAEADAAFKEALSRPDYPTPYYKWIRLKYADFLVDTGAAYNEVVSQYETCLELDQKAHLQHERNTLEQYIAFLSSASTNVLDSDSYLKLAFESDTERDMFCSSIDTRITELDALNRKATKAIEPWVRLGCFKRNRQCRSLNGLSGFMCSCSDSLCNRLLNHPAPFTGPIHELVEFERSTSLLPTTPAKDTFVKPAQRHRSENDSDDDDDDDDDDDEKKEEVLIDEQDEEEFDFTEFRLERVPSVGSSLYQSNVSDKDGDGDGVEGELGEQTLYGELGVAPKTAYPANISTGAYKNVCLYDIAYLNLGKDVDKE